MKTTVTFHALDGATPIHLHDQDVTFTSTNRVARLVTAARALAQHLADTAATAGDYQFTVDGTTRTSRWDGAYIVDCECTPATTVCGLFLCSGTAAGLVTV